VWKGIAITGVWCASAAAVYFGVTPHIFWGCVVVTIVIAEQE
jgi:hypothetical protein